MADINKLKQEFLEYLDILIMVQLNLMVQNNILDFMKILLYLE